MVDKWGFVSSMIQSSSSSIGLLRVQLARRVWSFCEISGALGRFQGHSSDWAKAQLSWSFEGFPEFSLKQLFGIGPLEH